MTENDLQKYHYKVHLIKTAEDIAPLFLRQNNIFLVNAQKGHNDTQSTETIYTWSDLPPDSFSVVIVDEAHHLPSKTWKNIVSRFQAHAKVVFFTATPFRADKKKITEDIDSTRLAYHMNRMDAVKKGIIRDTNPIGLEQEGSYVVSESLQKAKDLLPKIKMRLEEKNRAQPLPGGTKHMAILMASCILDTEKICDEWNDKYSPLTALTINSKMPLHKQKSVMCDLKSGKLTLLVIVQMLLEGFDHPPISVAAIATKVDSPVRFAQFIGRAQRVYRHDGEPEPSGITADIISDGFFKQRRNYEKFKTEELIPLEEETD